MSEILDFVKDFDIHNLFAIGIIFWVITRGWRNEVREEIKQQSARTDKLYEMFCEMQREIKDIYREWNTERKK